MSSKKDKRRIRERDVAELLDKVREQAADARMLLADHRAKSERQESRSVLDRESGLLLLELLDQGPIRVDQGAVNLELGEVKIDLSVHHCGKPVDGGERVIGIAEKPLGQLDGLPVVAKLLVNAKLDRHELIDGCTQLVESFLESLDLLSLAHDKVSSPVSTAVGAADDLTVGAAVDGDSPVTSPPPGEPTPASLVVRVAMSEEQRQRLLLSLEVDRAGCRARQLRALRDLEKAELVDDPSCSDVAEAWSREVERLDALTDLLSEAVGRHE